MADTLEAGATGDEFKQFSYLIDNIYEPKLQNRFVLSIPGLPQLNFDEDTKVDGSSGSIDRKSVV